MVKYGINQTQAASSNKIRFKMHLLPSLTPELIYSNITASLRSKIYEFFFLCPVSFYIKAQCLTFGRMLWTMPWLWPGKQERWDSIVLLNDAIFLVLKPCYLCCPQIVRDALQNDLKIMCKSSSVDLVTKTDQNVEQLIITSVKEKFPEHRYWV